MSQGVRIEMPVLTALSIGCDDGSTYSLGTPSRNSQTMKSEDGFAELTAFYFSLDENEKMSLLKGMSTNSAVATIRLAR